MNHSAFLFVLLLLQPSFLPVAFAPPSPMNSSSDIVHPTAKSISDDSMLTATLTKSLVATAISAQRQKGAMVKLAQELIRVPSVTPNDFGCQDIIRKRLERLGFTCETLQYHDVTNLWAVLHPLKNSNNNQGKLITFVGHTDVVPAGPEEAWSHPPFNADIVDGILYGRGAVDMKGGIAAYIVALERFLEKYPGADLSYSLGILLTSDEEGDAKWGTREVLTTLESRGINIDMAIVGEPSSLIRVGDVVKVGRRGSLGGDLSLIGIQGHVAYPHLAKNPIHESLGALKEMVDEVWDEGTEDFPPTSFQISNIQSGTGVLNVIPGFQKVHFNFRYSPATTDEKLKARVQEILKRHGLKFTLLWSETACPFLTPGGELVAETMTSVQETMGYTARSCTSGGTSDGRFVAGTYKDAQIVELGLINQSIHQVDEHVPLEDLERLATIYQRLLERLLIAESTDTDELAYEEHVDVRPLP